jgi:8-oxo-dGTP diphosphatase
LSDADGGEGRVSQKVAIEVVAAVVERDGRYLITQRNPRAVFPLYWEFPGGKVEAGEDDPTALRREMQEELEADVEVGDLLGRTLHDYPDFGLDFRVYRCRLRADHLACVNVHDLRWVTLDEMSAYPFPPADEDAIRRLVQESAGSAAGSGAPEVTP